MAKIGGICEQQSCKRFKEFYNQFIFETSIYKAEVKFVELRQSITSTCLIAYLAHVATNHSHLPDFREKYMAYFDAPRTYVD